ncbi:hypothetical protein AB0K51_11165 [Kitasatospora sp. NPDC049285]|uniref:hypothetical protein n=1 Tax=Kitasatospora sp. NPDC049285 TaxID=3157096 RepID=UPI00342B8EE9
MNVLQVRGRQVGIAVAAAAVVTGGAVWAATPTSGGPHPLPLPAASSAPATPSDSPTPTPSPTLSPTPSPTPSPDPATPTTTPQATAAKAHASKTPITEVTPGTHCNCDNTTPSRNPDCHYDAQGRLMACGPILSLSPLPNPAASPSRFTAGTVPPGARL